MLDNDPDVRSDLDLWEAVYQKYVSATCQSKRLRYEQGGVDAGLASSIYQNCTTRLLAEEPSEPPLHEIQVGTGDGHRSGGTTVTASHSSAGCELKRTRDSAGGSNTKYGYSIRCNSGVSPNSILISASPSQPAFTDQNDLGPEPGVTFTKFDKAANTASFALQTQGSAARLELIVPTSSTELKSADYYIASGSLKDASKCTDISSAVPEVCSTGTVMIPVQKSVVAAQKDECPIVLVDESGAKPELAAIAIGTTVTGKLAKGAKGDLQFCVDKKLVHATVTMKDTGDFTANLGATALKDGQVVTAQLLEGAKIYGPPSAEVSVGSCSGETHTNDSPPTLDSISLDKTGQATPTGTVVDAPTGTSVRICVNDHQALPKLDPAATGKPSLLAVANGKFSGGIPIPIKLKDGDQVVAQSRNKDNDLGGFSNVVAIGACSKTGTGASSAKPTVGKLTVGSPIVTGTAPDSKEGTIRVCVDDAQVATDQIRGDGSFKIVLPRPLGAGQSVIAQVITSPGQFPNKYGPPSIVNDKQGVPTYAYSDLTTSFVAGVEQSGYSAQVTNTNAFIQGFFRSEYWPFGKRAPTKPFGVAVWGRVRLLSAPQPSTNYIGSIVNDPTGSITKQNWSQVGQVIDYVLGPEIRIVQKDRPDGNTSRLSLVGGFGATTPLTSNTQVLTYEVPAPNTANCYQLASRYPPQIGVAGLYLGPTNPTTGQQKDCLISNITGQPYKFVSLTNQDRSNFLFKYGAGIRYTHVYPAKGDQKPYSGSIDLSIGQDETVTGGTLHGAVFRIDSVYPIAFGASPYFYIFGSASMRLSSNVSNQPLILTVPQGNVPQITDPTVTVLALQQPNRDFYRIGFGMNLIAIVCGIKKDLCNPTNAGTSVPADTTGTTPPATTATTDPTKTTKGTTSPAAPKKP